MKDTKMQKLLHSIGTAQILMDQLFEIKNDAKLDKIDYFVQDTKAATNLFIKKIYAVNKTLAKIWEHIPNEDFDAYLKAKKELITLILKSSYEDIQQLIIQIKDVHYKYKQLDVFEKMLNTHCTPEMRDIYRNELGYTLDQYNQLKQNQELGYAPTYENLQN